MLHGRSAELIRDPTAILELVGLLQATLGAALRSRRRLIVENLLLRQQLQVALRSQRRPRLRARDKRCAESVKLWGAELPTHVTAFLALRLSSSLSGSPRQARAKDVHRGHDSPHSLLMSGQGGTVTRDELAQQDIATTQRLHGLEAFERTLPSGQRL